MNDVTVVTSVTYPSPESLALVADVQYHEPYLSAALNRKFRGIVDPGFYAGFLPKPGGGMNLLITSVDGDKTAGAASVDIGEFYQVTIQHRKDISLALNAGKKYAIVLKGRYLLGEDTYQVNTASHIHAAEFVARTYTDSYQLGDGELLVCTVNIPAGVSTITQEMIDTSERINRTIGIDISDSVTSTRSDVAASSLAVKKAYDLAKSKYTAQDASTTQKGLVQLSSETNSDSETMAATPKAVKSVKDLADTKAPIESPSLTGTPTAPTAAQGTNNTQIATTAYVRAAISALVGSSPEALDTLNELAEALGNDPNFATTMTNALAGKQPLDATLTALAGLPTGANKLPYFTGKDTVAQTDLTPVGRDILAKSSTQAIIQYLGLGETINLAKNAVPATRRVNNKPLTGDITLWASDVGALPIAGGQLNGALSIGTDNALGGNSIVLGDNDTGFKQDGDGVLGIYANNARVGYIDNSGLHMSVDVLTNGAVRAGDGKKLSLTSNNNSTMTATFNLWGDANRPTVIELDDDQGWHLYSQRNPDGSIVFTVNGDITANTLRAGGAIYQNNGDIFGSVWGGWLSLWIKNNFVADVQLGAGTSVVTWNNAGSWPNTPGYVVTSVWKDTQGENIDGINYAPLQKRVGNQWYTVQGGTV
ncbi:tail fiber protein [Salmonella enterica]|nr:tail fiber protein [Salmonella enterica]